MNEELVIYIEKEILPLYDRNDEGHNREHVNDVIKRSFEIVEDNQLDVDKNICYTIAAYHDLGCYIDRATHEILSAEIFMKDETIKQFFSEEERIVIKEGIQDHRASSNHEPRSIYGKIITVADKGNKNTEELLQRMYKSLRSGKKGYHELGKAEKVNRIYHHMVEKFGDNGYAKIWIEDEKYVKNLEKIREDIRNKEQCLKKIEEIIEKEEKD